MILKEKLDRLLYKVERPERYIGNEWNEIVKSWTDDKLKVVLSFPDTYEIGMSHLGLKILYHLLNREDDILCERAYAPWPDLEKILREEELSLFSLESKHEIEDFDIFAFTLQYEMSYTNIVNMLDLANLPLFSKDRDQDFPLVIAGGSTVYNPEPLAPFIDLLYIGEAEKTIVNLVNAYRKLERQGLNRRQILKEMSNIDGVYVPSLYNISYTDDGRVQSIESDEGVKQEIKRQVAANLDQAFYPVDFIVPYMDIVHDRGVLEIARGCTGGCRFCAAGMTYRPVRERSKETLINLADKILDSTGYREISLTSLSTVDYSQIEDLVKTMAARYEEKNISISLSSLRVDQFSVKLAQEVQKVRKSGLTFAPEAGTQRLRNVINKGVEEEELYKAAEAAFESGWFRIKLYFMIGLPTETEEDLAGIVNMVKKVRSIGREIRKQKKHRMRPIKVSVSISTFVPKPFTPFQWVKMISREQIIQKQSYLKKHIRGKGLELNWNDPETSLLEGIFARGDRRLASVIKSAWEKGACFDGWNDYFDHEIWQSAFVENEIEPDDYLGERNLDEILPWSHFNFGVSAKFLRREYDRAFLEENTSDCRFDECSQCGICFDFDVEMDLAGVDDNDAQS